MFWPFSLLWKMSRACKRRENKRLNPPMVPSPSSNPPPTVGHSSTSLPTFPQSRMFLEQILVFDRASLCEIGMHVTDILQLGSTVFPIMRFMGAHWVLPPGPAGLCGRPGNAKINNIVPSQSGSPARRWLCRLRGAPSEHAGRRRDQPRGLVIPLLAGTTSPESPVEGDRPGPSVVKRKLGVSPGHVCGSEDPSALPGPLLPSSFCSYRFCPSDFSGLSYFF